MLWGEGLTLIGCYSPLTLRALPHPKQADLIPIFPSCHLLWSPSWGCHGGRWGTGEPRLLFHSLMIWMAISLLGVSSVSGRVKCCISVTASLPWHCKVDIIMHISCMSKPKLIEIMSKGLHLESGHNGIPRPEIFLLYWFLVTYSLCGFWQVT